MKRKKINEKVNNLKTDLKILQIEKEKFAKFSALKNDTKFDKKVLKKLNKKIKKIEKKVKKCLKEF